MLKKDLVLILACLAFSYAFCTQAQAQITFVGTNETNIPKKLYADSRGDLYEDEELTKLCNIEVKCSDPQNNLSGSYDFSLVDEFSAGVLVDFDNAENDSLTINCNSGKKKSRTLEITELAQELLSNSITGDIETNLSLQYSDSRPNPGFVTLILNLTICNRTSQTGTGIPLDDTTVKINIDKKLTVDLPALPCFVLEPDGEGGYRLPSFPILPSFTADFELSEEFLESLSTDASFSTKRLTNAEIVTALAKQVNNATITLKLPRSVLRTLDMINYNGTKYNLQNAVINTINTSTAGRITATVTGNLRSVKTTSEEETLQIAGFDDKLLRRFVPDADARAILTAGGTSTPGGSISADQIPNLEKVMKAKARYKFTKTKGTLFQKFKKPKKAILQFLIKSDDEE